MFFVDYQHPFNTKICGVPYDITLTQLTRDKPESPQTTTIFKGTPADGTGYYQPFEARFELPSWTETTTLAELQDSWCPHNLIKQIKPKRTLLGQFANVYQYVRHAIF